MATPPFLLVYSLNDGVATLTLVNGKMNAVFSAVIEAFNAALDKAQAAELAVIVSGQPSILRGEYDLKVMTAGTQTAINLVATGSTLARSMLAHPQPIIVACSGHAVAKGSFVLLLADYRIGVEGAFTIGLNEVKVDMTMHHVGIALARDRLSTPVFQRSVINAEMFNPQSAMAAGFLDQVVPADQLLATANAVAEEFKKLNMKAHSSTKLKVCKGLLDALDAAIASDKLSSLH